jgi:hypothetical protein
MAPPPPAPRRCQALAKRQQRLPGKKRRSPSLLLRRRLRHRLRPIRTPPANRRFLPTRLPPRPQTTPTPKSGAGAVVYQHACQPRSPATSRACQHPSTRRTQTHFREIGFVPRKSENPISSCPQAAEHPAVRRPAHSRKPLRNPAICPRSRTQPAGRRMNLKTAVSR